MANPNNTENGGTEKDGYKDYSSFSNDLMYDCHMVEAHLLAMHSLMGKIQAEAHEYIPMPIKEDLASVGYLLRSAREKLVSVTTAMDDSYGQYEKKSTLVVGA